MVRWSIKCSTSLDLLSIILFWKKSRKIDHVSCTDTELIWELIFTWRCWSRWGRCRSGGRRGVAGGRSPPGRPCPTGRGWRACRRPSRSPRSCRTRWGCVRMERCSMSRTWGGRFFPPHRRPQPRTSPPAFLLPMLFFERNNLKRWIFIILYH